MAGDFSREDDPLGADADKLAKAVTAKELTDGTVVAWLNGSDHSYHNWIQGENGPVISDKPVAYALAVSGDYKTTYTIGDELDLTGLVLTATWTDGDHHRHRAAACGQGYYRVLHAAGRLCPRRQRRQAHAG